MKPEKAFREFYHYAGHGVDVLIETLLTAFGEFAVIVIGLPINLVITILRSRVF